MGYGDNMKMKKPEMTGASMSTNGGHDPMVPRREKHSVKDKGFFNKKKMKGDC